MPPRGSLPRPDMRRVVVVVPSAFTLGNLFFGFWSIVSATNGNFRWAGWCIMFAGLLDMFDGRVARLANTTTRFGAELDSLVDVISFGVAPAMLMYFLDLRSAGGMAWLVCYLYVVCVTLRLARYNVMAATKGHSSWFTGLPSPAAGMTLASWYAFSQTSWYRDGVAYLNLDRQGLVVLMLVLSVLMVSGVQYPRWPRIGLRTPQGIMGLLIHGIILAGIVLNPAAFLFPLGLFYLVFGIARSTIQTLAERGDESLRDDAEGDEALVRDGTDDRVTPLVRRRRPPLTPDAGADE